MSCVSCTKVEDLKAENYMKRFVKCSVLCIIHNVVPFPPWSRFFQSPWVLCWWITELLLLGTQRASQSLLIVEKTADLQSSKDLVLLLWNYLASQILVKSSISLNQPCSSTMLDIEYLSISKLTLPDGWSGINELQKWVLVEPPMVWILSVILPLLSLAV